MDKLNVFSSKDIAKITQHRSGEIKFGEKIITVPSDENWISFITQSEAKFVLIGLPEDIGIKANLGRTGAASAFESTLKSLVNFQHNKFCKGDELLVLGEINFSVEMEISKTLDTQNKEDRKKLFQLVENIDKDLISSSSNSWWGRRSGQEGLYFREFSHYLFAWLGQKLWHSARR